VTLLIVHAAATWFMVGLIWTIQSVHYPLFARVGSDGFAAYEAEHASRMGRLLAVPAGLEVASAAALVWERPDGVGLLVVLVAGVLLVAIWIITAVVHVPLHGRLHEGPDPVAVRRLVAGNRIRTGLWTARGLFVVGMLLA